MLHGKSGFGFMSKTPRWRKSGEAFSNTFGAFANGILGQVPRKSFSRDEPHS
jgi:hypothetical protein